MKIICKYPTRNRPQQFLSTLKGWIDGAKNPDDISFLVSFDLDDPTMNHEITSQAAKLHPKMIFAAGDSKTKIDAVNSDMNIVESYAWQVVLVVSDDMLCRRYGWDEIISQKMTELYPDTDGVLWFHDNSRQRDIMTLSCIGRKYYQRDNYIYHKSYSSFFCDNEATEVARMRGKITFIDKPIASHQHPSWQAGVKSDELYRRNNRYWAADQENYHRRKSLGFPA